MEIQTEVETYRIDLECEKCEGGLMKCTGEGLTQWDTTWMHRCNKCGFEQGIINKNILSYGIGIRIRQ